MEKWKMKTFIALLFLANDGAYEEREEPAPVAAAGHALVDPIEMEVSGDCDETSAK
jgi:hypothetical protein